MAIFNTDIDYQGQDLHMLRNGKDFPLYKFFSSINNLTYDIRLKGDGSLVYEQIQVIIPPNKEIVIRGISFVPDPNNTNKKKVNNFFIIVTNVITLETTSILIHLHDSIDNMWISPKKLSIRQGMSIKIGVLASFSDGNYADLSFYPDIAIVLKSNENHIGFSVDYPQRIVVKTAPTNPPYLIENAITITYQDYMNNQNVQSPLQATGDIEILENFGELTFHNGNITDITKRINILFLSDGFNGTSGKTFSRFKGSVNKFIKDLLKKDAYSPWKLFKDKINVWSYYTQDQHNISSLEGEYIILKEHPTKPVLIDLYSFINFFDSYVVMNGVTPLITPTGIPYTLDAFDEDIKTKYSSEMHDFLELKSSNLPTSFALFKNNANTADENNILTLSGLCGRVGLPNQNDPPDFSIMYNAWTDRTLVDDVKLTHQALGQHQYFLHEYIFKIWRKLTHRIYIEKADTSYGVTNTYLHREQRLKFTPQRVLGPGISKFPSTAYTPQSIKSFGKYVSLIPGNNGAPQKFGEIYYNSLGYPTKNNLGNDKLNKIFQSSNNIVILSNIRNNGVYGVNQSFMFSELDSNNNPINFETNRSTVALENKLTKNFVITKDSSSGPIKFFQETFERKEVTNVVRNTIIHEFSHNYLVDEYSTSIGNLSDPANNTIRNQILQRVKDSNVQVGTELETQTNFIDGDLIKWRWPRIKKIGIGNSINGTTTPDEFICVVNTNAINVNDVKFSFAVNETILLRKRFLFDAASYVHCTVLEVTNSVKDYEQTIKIKVLSGISTTDYDQGFLIILPFWLSHTQNHYQELVHHKIRDAISNTNYINPPVSNKPGRPMVVTEKVSNNEPQPVDDPFLKWSSNFQLFPITNKFKTVGLYAGGFLSFKQGIYHPTGFCAMRGFENNEIIEKGIKITPNSFCPVCSYILIDHIDPLKHPIIDAKYGIYIDP